MPWQKGQSGFLGGRTDKPFRDALRLELAAAGEDQKALRAIARALITQAKAGELQAIREIADRIDGKPAQESSVDITARIVTELSDDELAAIAAGGRERVASQANGSGVTH